MIPLCGYFPGPAGLFIVVFIYYISHKKMDERHAAKKVKRIEGLCCSGNPKKQSVLHYWVTSTYHENFMLFFIIFNLWDTYATAYDWWSQDWFLELYSKAPQATILINKIEKKRTIYHGLGYIKWWPNNVPGFYMGLEEVKNPCGMQEIQFNWGTLWQFYNLELASVWSMLGFRAYMLNGWGIVDFLVCYARSMEFMLKALQDDCTDRFLYKHRAGIIKRMTLDDYIETYEADTALLAANGNDERYKQRNASAPVMAKYRSLEVVIYLGLLKYLKLFTLTKLIKSRYYTYLLRSINSVIAKRVTYAVTVALLLIAFYSVLGAYLFGGYGFWYIPGWITHSDVADKMALCFTGNGWYTAYKDSIQALKSSTEDNADNTTALLALCLYMAVAVIVLHFNVFNLFVGLYINAIDSANKEYKQSLEDDRVQARQNLTNYIKKQRELKMQGLTEEEQLQLMSEKEQAAYYKRTKYIRLHENLQKLKNQGNFYEHFSDFKSNLSGDREHYTVSQSVVTSLHWIETEYDALDALDDQTYKCQQMLFEMYDVLCKKADVVNAVLPKK